MSNMKMEIHEYMDANGLVAPSPVPNPYVTKVGSQNGLRFTSEWYIILYKRKEMSYGDFLSFERSIKTCEKEPGLYNRSLGSDEQEGPDDYVALCSAAASISPDTAKAIDDYGNAHNYVFNNNQVGKFSLSAFLGRQLQIVAHMKWAAGRVPNLLQQLVWAFVVATSGKPGDQDAWALSYHLVNVAENKNFLTRFASRLWKKRLAKYYPGGMSEALKGYYSDNHPILRYWVDL